MMLSYQKILKLLNLKKSEIKRFEFKKKELNKDSSSSLLNNGNSSNNNNNNNNTNTNTNTNTTNKENFSNNLFESPNKRIVNKDNKNNTSNFYKYLDSNYPSITFKDDYKYNEIKENLQDKEIKDNNKSLDSTIDNTIILNNKKEDDSYDIINNIENLQYANFNDFYDDDSQEKTYNYNIKKNKKLLNFNIIRLLFLLFFILFNFCPMFILIQNRINIDYNLFNFSFFTNKNINKISQNTVNNFSKFTVNYNNNKLKNKTNDSKMIKQFLKTNTISNIKSNNNIKNSNIIKKQTYIDINNVKHNNTYSNLIYYNISNNNPILYGLCFLSSNLIFLLLISILLSSLKQRFNVPEFKSNIFKLYISFSLGFIFIIIGIIYSLFFILYANEIIKCNFYCSNNYTEFKIIMFVLYTISFVLFSIALIINILSLRKSRNLPEEEEKWLTYKIIVISILLFSMFLYYIVMLNNNKYISSLPFNNYINDTIIDNKEYISTYFPFYIHFLLSITILTNYFEIRYCTLSLSYNKEIDNLFEESFNNETFENNFK